VPGRFLQLPLAGRHRGAVEGHGAWGTAVLRRGCSEVMEQSCGAAPHYLLSPDSLGLAELQGHQSGVP